MMFVRRNLVAGSTFTLNLFATRLRAFHWLFMERFKKKTQRLIFFKKLTFYSGKAKVYSYKNSLLCDLDFRKSDPHNQESLLWRDKIWPSTRKDRTMCVCRGKRKKHYDVEKVWAKDWRSWSHVGPVYRKQRICIEK